MVIGVNKGHVHCDTYSQVLTGARAGGTTATEYCAWDLRAGCHWKHTHNDILSEHWHRIDCTCRCMHTHIFIYILHTLLMYLDSGQSYRLWPQFPAPHSSSPPLLDWDCHTLSSCFEPLHRMTWYTPSSCSTDPSHRHLERAKTSC